MWLEVHASKKFDPHRPNASPCIGRREERRLSMTVGTLKRGEILDSPEKGYAQVLKHSHRLACVQMRNQLRGDDHDRTTYVELRDEEVLYGAGSWWQVND